jgi:hypothetical protein
VAGLSDLEVGMLVHVEGERTEGGSILAQVVIAEPDPPLPGEVLYGTVHSVGAGDFELAVEPGLLMTVRVGEETQWGGQLTGFGDLAAGMAVVVEGERQSDGSLAALMVADDALPPEAPTVVEGLVVSVSASSFVVGMDPAATDGVTVTVDEATQWLGMASGIGDLEIQTWVMVEGLWVEDGVLAALTVMDLP